MTIAAGFKCGDGYLLAADTLVTIRGMSKLAQSKIRHISTKSCQAVFAIAGDVEFTNRCLELIKIYLDAAKKDVEEVKNALDLACFELWDKYRAIRADFPDLYLQMLGVISVQGQKPEFLKINGPIVSPGGDYSCIGTGEPLANFFTSRMFSSRLSQEETIRLAAFIIFNAKRHVDGCGGISQFVQITGRGTWIHPFVDDGGFHILSELEQSFIKLDRFLGQITFEAINHKKSKEEFAQEVKKLAESIVQVRNTYVDDVAQREQRYIETQLETQIDNWLESEEEHGANDE